SRPRSRLPPSRASRLGGGRGYRRLRHARVRQRDAVRQSGWAGARALLRPRRILGHRSAVSTRKGGGFYGYKIQAAVCTRTGLPLAWQIETARRNESLFVAPLLDALRARGFQPETCAMDKAYDSNRVHAECAERGVHPVIPIKGERGRQIVLPIIEGATRFNPRIQRHTERYRVLYRGRAAVEREVGRLKPDCGLSP